MLVCSAKFHHVVHHWELSNISVQKLTYPYSGKQQWFPNYSETCIQHSLRQCFVPHTVHLLQSLYICHLYNFPAMGHFSTSFFSVVCSKLKGFTVFQFSYTDLNILIIAAGSWQLNTSSIGTIIYKLPFLVLHCCTMHVVSICSLLFQLMHFTTI